MSRDIPAALVKLIEALRRHPADSQPGRLLANHLPGDGVAEALAWLRSQAANDPLALVFSLEIPGFIWLGLEGQEQPINEPSPFLWGLRAAEEIFAYDHLAPHCLRASDWRASPEALEKALRRAADWVEPRCIQLAVAIRAIKVDKEGAPTFRPRRPTLVKTGVFSASPSPRPRA